MKSDKSLLRDIFASFIGSLLFFVFAHLVGLFRVPIPFDSRVFNVIFFVIYFLLLGWTVFVFASKIETIIVPRKKVPRFSSKVKFLNAIPIVMLTLYVGYSATGWLSSSSSKPDSSFDTFDPKPRDNYVKIKSIELLEKFEDKYAHDREYLYKFILRGELKVDHPEKYSIIFFYKNLDHPDQRYGWFCVEALDRFGWDHPNAVPVDELNPSSWEFVTSRIYVEKKYKPRFAFIAFVLPDSSKYLKQKLYLTRRHNGSGWADLEFLKEVQGTTYSPIKIFYNGTSRK